MEKIKLYFENKMVQFKQYKTQWKKMIVCQKTPLKPDDCGK